MVRVIVLVGVMVAVVFSGGALADVSREVDSVVIRRADGALVRGRITRATEIECTTHARPCDRGSLKRGAVVVRAELRPAPGGDRLVRRLVLRV